MYSDRNSVIGIIPCAGLGSRLGHLPFSKELYPLGKTVRNGKLRLKVAIEYLIDHMKDAGIRNIHMVLRNGKWDIPSYFGGGLDHGFSATYHVVDYTYGVPFSVYQVTKSTTDKTILLGFPDILFNPKNAYRKLLSVLNNSENSNIVLGLMPVLKPEKWDMVELDHENNVTNLLIKSEEGIKQPYGWTIAAWKSKFSVFLNDRIKSILKEKTSEELATNEIYFGHIIQDAIMTGMKVRSVILEDGNCLDIGTPDDLMMSEQFLQELK